MPTPSRLAPFSTRAPACSFVDVEPAGNGLAEAEPELERRLAAILCGEPRPARLPGEDRAQHVITKPPRDHCRDTGSTRHLRRHDLAPHPSATELGADSDLGLASELALGQELGSRRPRRARIDAFDLGQEDEQSRPDEDRDLGSERIVVPERDLVGRSRVVLVDDRHGAETKELGERLTRVHVGGPVGDVSGREQDLSRRNPVPSQRLLPRGLELRLAERGGRLQLSHRARSAPEAELREPQRDRPRGNDADRLSGRDQRTDLSRARV